MPGRKEREYYSWFMEEHNTHLKRSWIQYQVEQKDGVLMYPPPLFPPPPPPLYSSHGSRDSSNPSTTSSSSGAKISPAVLFVIVILAVLFFISGLLHLLVRFLIKRPSSSGSSQSNNRYPELSGPEALQRQLQQLFHLHDSGLDQAFIDALPVFNYKEIVGLKEPFDCAVCLCEFLEKDMLRLLPTCSHAFHINCIDTWLLSNSTCPLCRDTLFIPEFSMENPMFDFDGLREEEGCAGDLENRFASSQKTVEIKEVVVKKGVLPVRLGKFKRLNDEPVEVGGESSSSNLDARRCFSMGSYQYVLGNSDLRVPLCNDQRAHDLKLLKGIERRGPLSIEGELEGKKITSASKGESFSVSKIWLWPKKGRFSGLEQTALPSSLNSDLSWMTKKEEQELEQ